LRLKWFGRAQGRPRNKGFAFQIDKKLSITKWVLCTILSPLAPMTKYQVRDWMTPTPITVDASNNLSVAYHLMRINQVRRLPVIGRNGKLVGIITTVILDVQPFAAARR